MGQASNRLVTMVKGRDEARQAGLLAENPCPRLSGDSGSRILGIVIVQSVAHWNRDGRSPPWATWLRHDRLGNPVPNPLVWQCLVEVFDEFLLEGLPWGL
jgi:hypothetical protein